MVATYAVAVIVIVIIGVGGSVFVGLLLITAAFVLGAQRTLVLPLGLRFFPHLTLCSNTIKFSTTSAGVSSLASTLTYVFDCSRERTMWVADFSALTTIEFG